MAYFSKPEELIDYWYEALNVSNLGLEFVGYLEEQLKPVYPAIVLGEAVVQRELHATHQFQETISFNFFIYHAKLTMSRRTRTQEDLELVTRVREFLHADLNCRNNRGTDGVVFGFVTDETPAIFRRTANDAVIITRIGWQGATLNSFV